MSSSDRAPVVRGFRFAGVSAGIKKTGKKDLGLIVADRPVSCAGVFTTNQIVAAPVVLSRAKLADDPIASVVVVNSGNANACTGAQGVTDAKRMAERAAVSIGCQPEHVQVCSTGVIGAPLPMDRVELGIAKATAALDDGGFEDFADAILTTDTRRKVRSARLSIDGTTVNIVGCCKGAGMIHPNMATMLGFVVTDAEIEEEALVELWGRACAQSFNAITVDGDTSTNDTALILASGHAEVPVSRAGLAEFEAALFALTSELARDILRDAEGSTKTVSITVTGTATAADARRVAETVALSPLVKTAFHGEDPNWGRIIAAAGRSGVQLDPQKLSLYIGETALYTQAVWQGREAEASAHQTMKGAEFSVTLDLGLGAARATVHTCDFSADYVRINADYRS